MSCQQRKKTIVESFDATVVDVSYSLINCYKNVLSFGLELDAYSWKHLDEIKQIIETNKEITNTISSKKNITNYFVVNEWEKYIGEIIKYWFRIYIKKEMVLSHIIDILLMFYNPEQELKWSQEYNSNHGNVNKYYNINSFQFSDDMKCVKKIGKLQFREKYILPDVDEIYKGIHCWRVHVINPGILIDEDEWIMFGVGQKRKYLDSSYQEAYGISVLGEYFPSNIARNNKYEMKTIWDFEWYFNELKQYEIDVDILLNIDKCTLNICTVGISDDRKQAKIWNLPPDKGWVPHLNIRALNAQLTIKKIPSLWYGKENTIDSLIFL